MHVRTQFAGNAFTRVFNTAYAFFIPNLFFLVTNIWLIITLLTVPLTLRNTLPYLLACVPMGPAFIVLFRCADDFLTHHELPRWWRLFRQYGQAAKKIIGVWTAALAILYIAIVDSFVFVQSPLGKWLLPLMVIVSLVALITGLSFLTFAYRNPDARFKPLLQAALMLTGRRWYIGLINLVLFALFLLTLAAKPALGFMIAPIIFTTLLSLNNHQAFRTIQKGR